VWFDEKNKLHRVSNPFFFQKKGIEFAAGLSWHPDGERLLISYGTADKEAWISTIDAGQVRDVLVEVENLPSSAPGTFAPGILRLDEGTRLRDNAEIDALGCH
jgi:hypothetical protein